MRQQIQEGFRKAGKTLQDLDYAYSDKVNAFLLGDPEKASMPRQIGAGILSHPLTPDRIEFDANDTRKEKILGRAYQATTPVIGGAVRYGLPAAGVTAAGMGLAQLANTLGQQTESTIMPQGYNYIENVPLERNFNGSSEGELLVSGSRGFGPYKDYDPVILGSRVNDLQEQNGFKPVRASGYYANGVIPED